MKKLLKISGKCGQIYVYSGIFNITSTIGIPLSNVLLCFKKNNGIVDWLNYYKSAIKSGMKKERVLSRISEAIIEDFYVEKNW